MRRGETNVTLCQTIDSRYSVSCKFLTEAVICAEKAVESISGVGRVHDLTIWGGDACPFVELGRDDTGPVLQEVLEEP